MNADDSGPGSLRATLAAAADGDHVAFDASLAGRTIALTSGELMIDKSLTIEGLGADQLTVSGSDRSRVFDITAAAAAVQMTGLRITAGNSNQGGGIYSAGDSVTLAGMILSANRANSNNPTVGGGIYLARGNLTLIDNTLSDNMAVGVRIPLPNAPGGTGLGGGIYVAGGSTEIVRSTLSDNQASGGTGGLASTGGLAGAGGLGPGGGIYVAGGSLVLTASTLTDNRTSGGTGGTGYGSTLGTGGPGGPGGAGSGGGIYLGGGSSQITASTLTDNRTSGGTGGTGGAAGHGRPQGPGGPGGMGEGGGIYAAGASLTLTDCTLFGNQTLAGSGGPGGSLGPPGSASGGGIANNTGTLTVTGSTISGNTGGNSPGLMAAGGTTALRNTIIAGNGGRDVTGALHSLGHNLIGNGSGGTGYDPTDLVGTVADPIDPLLGPLRDNGGPTQTMAPLPGSPAVDAGDDADAPDFDQRGDGYARVVGGAIDIGAVEAQIGDAVTVALAAPAEAVSGVPFDITVTALDAYGHVAAGYAGAVTFAASDGDPGVALPADYAFQASDAGAVTLPGGVTLVTPGDQALIVTDTASGISGSAVVTVAAGSSPVGCPPPGERSASTPAAPASPPADTPNPLLGMEVAEIIHADRLTDRVQKPNAFRPPESPAALWLDRLFSTTDAI